MRDFDERPIHDNDPFLLPDPAPREVWCTVISVDDHLVEPAHTFEGRLPKRLQDRAPRVIETPEGHQVWTFDGKIFPEVALNANAGRRDLDSEPRRFEHIRRGCWDIDARIADMDLNGVWASLCFPSRITGFCGRVFSECSDSELGIATMRAWNDWMFEEWYSSYPERIIPMGLPYLTDTDVCVEEIYRNAERGVRAISMPERPHLLGLPSLFTDYWDPVIEACVATDTVINLHAGSTGGWEPPEGAPSLDLRLAMFSQLSMTACVEWLMSGYPERFPDLKIALSEGGIGWVAMLVDRLEAMVNRRGAVRHFREAPAEVLLRSFWFCSLGDPSTIGTRSRIGVDNIMIEVDYPHSDGTWPHTQQVIKETWGDLPLEDLRAICSGNAARLYRHPLPDVVLPV